ncbi:MAG TPA: hypothetical protein VF179_24315 [Thermoanaerobaculia bacterium]|nr:hypothetical protein [Thermoanaerobaculia bacterium]
MSFPPGCLDEPSVLLKERLCVHNVSKDVRGELVRNVTEFEKCAEPGCLTLKTVHDLKVEVRSHDCDSKLGQLLDGTLVVERLVTAFEEDGLHRGVHAGDFVWKSKGGLIRGRMSGITNAGTHREPVFKPCERCDERGVFTGRLCGEVVDANVSELKESKVVAIYKIRYDPSEKGGEGSVYGTLEGMVICPCHHPA